MQKRFQANERRRHSSKDEQEVKPEEGPEKPKRYAWEREKSLKKKVMFPRYIKSKYLICSHRLGRCVDFASFGFALGPSFLLFFFTLG